MKKISLLSALFGFAFIGAASAANITLYYSPSCPHCHHARAFISEHLIYEYPELQVTAVNVMDAANRDMFQEALTKCEFESGGVPVMVIGDTCKQGYADFMQDELRSAVESDLTDAQKATAAENKKAMESDSQKFRAEHADRIKSVVEYNPELAKAESAAKKNEGNGVVWFWGLLIVLVAGLGYVLVRKVKNK